MKHQQASPERLSRRVKFVYAMGDWGTSAAATVRNAFWFVFLTNVVGLNPGLAGVSFFVGKLWDGVNDPLVGMLSDRLHTRWGRRRPFLIFGAVPFGLSFFFLFWIPPLSSEIALAAYYSLAFILFDTLFTVINVPYSALTPELSDDYDERSSLAAWRIAVSILAALVTAATFTLLAEDLFGARFGGGPAGIRRGYLLAAGVWAVTLALPPLWLAFTIREPQRAPDPDPIRPWQTIREVFSNRPFRYGALIYLLSFATVDIMLVVFIRFLIDYVQVDQGFDNLLLGVMLGLAFLSMPLNVKLMHRFGKRNTYIGSMMLMVVVLLVIARVPPGGQNMMLVAAVFAGLGYGAANAIPWAIVADVVEEDELKTGKRREGVYAGYLVFLRKLVSAFGVFIVGLALEAAGFISSTTGSVYIEQPQSALNAMRFFVSIFPSFMLIIAIWVAWRFPLDKARHNEIKAQLAERRRAQSDASL